MGRGTNNVSMVVFKNGMSFVVVFIANNFLFCLFHF